MARFSASQIYAFARAAGFSPDESATMTAIALAESGGNARAHNPHGEDSRGLWQINARAHPDLAGRYDLYDPAENARAAYEVSMRGDDVSPWTTTHGGSGARYVRFRGEAESAAMAYGDGPGRGMWTGTSGYGDTTDAGLLGATGGTSADVFLSAALSQRGDSYVYGAETVLTDSDPEAFDCSELTQWAAAQADVELPDGAMNQYLYAKEHGYLVPVSDAIGVPGALLFDFSTEPTPGGARPSLAHVAISLGDHTTIEARGTSYGVNEFDADGRFTYAAVIPGLAGGDPSATVGADGLDIDHDRIPDETEVALGLDPQSADTDRDGVTDGYELLDVHTNPRLADSDGDLFGDAFEIAHGLDPTQPDIGQGSALDVGFADVLTTAPDDDLTALASAAGTAWESDSGLADSDVDGYSDALERFAGSDPLSAGSTPAHLGSGHDDPGLDDHDLADG
jgi:cell wall-associated NlpC family hydrolase